MNIIIADDHPLFRDALGQLIRQCAEPVSITEANSYTRLDQVLDESGNDTDLLFMDLNMPGGNAYDNIAAIHRRWPALPIIVITGSDSSEVVRMAITRGAIGFLPKSLDSHNLQSALTNILSGSMAVIPPITDKNAGHIQQSMQQKLTDRQMQVLDLLCDGDTNKMIARKLGLTEGTVKVHVRAILQSLGVSNRTQAVAIIRGQR